MEYFIHLAILVGIYLILSHSFNLVFGLGMLINLAHVAVYAIGAYTTAILATYHGYGTISCLLLSGLLASALALSIGAISLKLSHEYFAIGSMAFSSVVIAVLINWKSLTRGVLGIPGIPRPQFFSNTEFFQDNGNFLIFVGLIDLLVLLFFFWIRRSPFARKLRALSEYESAAQALSINTTLILISAFAISSFFAGIAGSLFAYFINYVDPSEFSLQEMVFVLTIVVLGKPGSFWGVTFATIFLVLLPEPLRFIDIPESILGPMRMMIYAWILFGVVYCNRTRLFPRMRTV